MQNDLTLLYYTANLIGDGFMKRIQDHLTQISGIGLPIISVSQKPIDFGQNICVGDIGHSVYNVYKQVLIAAEAAKTTFVACVEDDALYTTEHFAFRPPDDAFYYDIARYNVYHKGVFYHHRKRIVMSMCIAPTELMVNTLRLRFEKYPNLLPPSELSNFVEPGRHEEEMGLPKVKLGTFSTSPPPLTINHKRSLAGLRHWRDKDIVTEELPYWGNAGELWRQMCDGN